MRRNSKVNPKLSKIVARQNYRDRQIDKWWKWSRGKKEVELNIKNLLNIKININ